MWPENLVSDRVFYRSIPDVVSDYQKCYNSVMKKTRFFFLYPIIINLYAIKLPLFLCEKFLQNWMSDISPLLPLTLT